MGCEPGWCSKTSTLEGIFIVTPSLEGWPTKAKEAPSLHEVRLTPLDTNPVFQCLGEIIIMSSIKIIFFVIQTNKESTCLEIIGKLLKVSYGDVLLLEVFVSKVPVIYY